MVSNAISATNIAPFIPELWSLVVIAATESELLFANHVDRKYEKELTYGDQLRVPNLADFGDANTVDTTTDIVLYDSLQSCSNIIINYNYYQAVGLGEQHQIQDRPDFLKAALEKCGYSVAHMIDDKLATLVYSLSKNEGTEGSSLTADVLINCYTDLNLNNVPDSNRVWIFDPESIQDLMKLDYFVRYDYVPEGVVSKGFQGRQIFGAPVYMTNNLTVNNTTYHDAVYMHKECLTLASQQKPTVFNFDWPQKFTKVVGVKTLFGVALMRTTFGIYIKTRS